MLSHEYEDRVVGRTAACVIVKNEARDIGEWLAYHHNLGFDALIVFDNESTDRTAEIVKAASKMLHIHLWPWHRSDAKTQTGAYEEACRTFRSEFEWIGFFDADEFLVLHQHKTVKHFLLRFEHAAAVAVNWAIFGSNGHGDFHKDLVIESFTRRSPSDFFQNRHIKSFVRPASVIDCPNPHFFHVQGGYTDACAAPMSWLHNVNGQDLPGGVSARDADYSICQLNHYFTRSRAHWAEKVSRGYPADIAIRKGEEFEIYNRNEVEDFSAAAHAGAVRTTLAKFMEAPSA